MKRDGAQRTARPTRYGPACVRLALVGRVTPCAPPCALCHSDFVIPSSLHIRASSLFDRYGAVRLDLRVRFPRFSIILGLFVMTACVCVGQTPSRMETGIEGSITISPTQPGPIRDDTPGSKPLANTAFVVESQKGQVASFTTDDQGHFRIPLAPGHYTVAIKGRKSSIGHFGPFEADVVSGKMTKVEWQCDSGIR
jgi:hypothetical protein